MKMTVIEPENYRQMPWKNGRGTTCEIARFPKEDDPFIWRVSAADISENGPFSFFPEYMRVINTLDGGGMRLTVDGRKTGSLFKFDPFVFSGESEVDSELLDGPIRDFNLIYRPDLCKARLEWLDLATPKVFCTQAATVLIYSIEALTIEAGQDEARLSAWATLWATNTERLLTRFKLTAPEGGRACLIELDAF